MKPNIVKILIDNQNSSLETDSKPISLKVKNCASDSILRATTVNPKILANAIIVLINYRSSGLDSMPAINERTLIFN